MSESLLESLHSSTVPFSHLYWVSSILHTAHWNRAFRLLSPLRGSTALFYPLRGLPSTFLAAKLHGLVTIISAKRLFNGQSHYVICASATIHLVNCGRRYAHALRLMTNRQLWLRPSMISNYALMPVRET